MIADDGKVEVVDRWGTGFTVEVSLAGRHLRQTYDPRELGPFWLVESPRWLEAPDQPIERADLDRVIELLWANAAPPSPLLERVEPEGCYVARRWQRGDAGWLARVVCTSHPFPERPGHGTIECLALGRTAIVPFVARLPVDAQGKATFGAPIAELRWSSARWVFPAHAELEPHERARLAAWLAHAQSTDFFLTGSPWTVRDA